MNTFGNAVAIAFAVVALGCGDDTSGSGGSGGAGAGGGGTGGAAAACDAGQVCLTVNRQGEASGQLAVVWFRLEGTLAKDPTVGFQQAFAGTEEAVTIDLASVTPPTDVDLLCERACADVLTCPCTGTFKASVGYVMVVVDENNDGTLAPAEIGKSSNIVGIANTAVIYAASTVAAAPAPFDQTFPEGVKEGMAPYRINQDGAYLPADAGTSFELKVGPDVF